MVFDKIENYNLYTSLNERFQMAFEWIRLNDLSKMESATYKIDGDDIFAMLQEYDTKDVNDAMLEGHYKYIDIQYIVSGEELMGIRPFEGQIPVEINEESDYAFYNGEASFVKVKQGMFTIFFPSDLHMPCIKVDTKAKVKKVVVKVRI